MMVTMISILYYTITITLLQGVVRADNVRLSNLPTIADDLELFATSLSNATLSNKTELSDSILQYLELHGPDYFG